MKSIKFTSLAFAFCALISSTSAFSVELKLHPKAVVELFTSQGCSSCPKADALLKIIGERDDVITLAYHVDYWDYAGWRDTFGSPEFTRLQKGYAHALGGGRLYTPQMIVNGQSAVVGSASDVLDATLAVSRLDMQLDLDIHDPASFTITIPSDGSTDSAILWLVPYRSSAEVTVSRGENSGKSLAYSDVVLSRVPIGTWSGKTGLSISLPTDETIERMGDGAAFVLQQRHGNHPGAIIAAASIETAR